MGREDTIFWDESKDTAAHYLRSENKVQYEHILIHENQFVGQILSQICDLELPLFYVYMVYKSPQIVGGSTARAWSMLD